MVPQTLFKINSGSLVFKDFGWETHPFGRALIYTARTERTERTSVACILDRVILKMLLLRFGWKVQTGVLTEQFFSFKIV